MGTPTTCRRRRISPQPAKWSRTSLDAGINLFDTAEGYGLGLAEEILGGALQEIGSREKAIIVTKVGPLFGSERVDGRACNLSAEHIVERCERSLKRLQTDYIDLYLPIGRIRRRRLRKPCRQSTNCSRLGKSAGLG